MFFNFNLLNHKKFIKKNKNKRKISGERWLAAVQNLVAI